MDKLEMQKCYDKGIELCMASGKLIRNAINMKKNIETKSSQFDLVTDTDKAVEKFVISEINEAFPNHRFIGEESVSAGIMCELTDRPTWIVDPIDGTTNFVHGFPFVCISIGFWVNKEPEFGIVYSPILEQMFSARKGEGAYLNGSKIHVSDNHCLQESLVCCEMGSSRDSEKLDCVYANIQNILPKVHGLRSMGSAALNMCHVAKGVADVYFEFGIHAWDMAAAVLIVREAGGVVIDTKGGDFDILGRRVICANSQKLALELSKILKQYRVERD